MTLRARPRSVLGLLLRLLQLHWRQRPAACLVLAGLGLGIAAAFAVLLMQAPADRPAESHACRLPPPLLPPAPAPAPIPRPAELTVVASRGAGQAVVGAPLPVKFALHNIGGEPLTVLRSLDGSDYQWRIPKISIEVRDADGALIAIPRGGRCGLTNPLTAEDFVTLAPNESMNPFGEGSFSHYALAWRPVVPGRYSVTLVYDTTGDDSQRGGEIEPSLSELRGKLVAGVYRSSAIEIDVEGF